MEDAWSEMQVCKTHFKTIVDAEIHFRYIFFIFNLIVDALNMRICKQYILEIALVMMFTPESLLNK